MLKDLDTLPEDPVELRAVSELLMSEVKALSLKVEQLQHQLHGRPTAIGSAPIQKAWIS